MATGPWQIYQSLPKKVADGAVISSHSFVALLLSSAYTPSVSTHAVLADIVANELAAANGYARQTLTGVAVTQSGANTSFSCNPIVFGPATGAGFAARYAAIFDDTPVGDPLLCVQLLDTTPADISVAAGVQLQLTPHANGVFRYVIV